MRIAIAMLVVTLAALAAGCNTISGIGQDVKAVGRGIEKAAEKAK